MNYSLLLDMALVRFGRYKMKTFLMGLGIVISVLSTVLIQTIGNGFRETFFAYIHQMYPSNSILLNSGDGVMGGGEIRNRLRQADIDTILSSVREIIDWDPRVFSDSPRDIKYAGKNTNVLIWGVSERSERVHHRGVSQGRFFTADDIQSKAHVALIGKTVATKLFPSESPIGAQLYIDNVPFKVQGVLTSWGVDPHGADQDDTIQVPYTTLMDQTRRDYFAGVTFLVNDGQQVEVVAQRIETVLRELFHIGPGQKNDFSVLTPVFLKEIVSKSFKIFDIFVPLISATAFMISALIVMGTMLVAVKERTAEIGLRKAVGARPRDLKLQILIEVLILALIASLVGFVLAQLISVLIAPVLAAKFGILHMTPSLSILVVTVVTAILTGTLSALVPASAAARLSPVEALR